MTAELWFILLLIPLVHSSKLTESENDRVKKICGATKLRRSMSLSFGGRHVRHDEYPWVVSIALKGRGNICSGALISQRHVLTAAHCVRKTKSRKVSTEEKCRKLKYKNTRELHAPVENFTLLIGSRCKTVARCPEFRTRAASAIYVPESFDECSIKNDLAIMEMSRNVSEILATPICTPRSSTVVAKKLLSAGNGRTAPLPVNASLDGQQVLDLELAEISNRNRIVTKSLDGVGICGGDSGGPLFQTDRYQRNTVVGVVSMGYTCYTNYKGNRTKKSRSPNPHIDYHTDVRKFASWICSVSGVCQ